MYIYIYTINKLWQQEWDLHNNNKLNKIKPLLSEQLPSCCHNRRAESVLSRIRVGHTWLTQSFILTKYDKPVCIACDCQLSVRHILLECHDPWEIRRYYFDTTSLFISSSGMFL